MTNERNKFQTSDIKTSAYLLSKNIPLDGIDKKDPRKVIFSFSNTNQVTNLLKEYWSGIASVNPVKLFESYEHLKDAIYRDYDI